MHSVFGHGESTSETGGLLRWRKHTTVRRLGCMTTTYKHVAAEAARLGNIFSGQSDCLSFCVTDQSAEFRNFIVSVACSVLCVNLPVSDASHGSVRYR